MVRRCDDPALSPVNNGIFNHTTQELEPFTPERVFLAKSPVDYIADAPNPVITMPDGQTWDVESWIADLSDDEGDAPSVTSVLLRASSQTITGRLGQREDGQSFDDHLERSNKMARHLDRAAPDTCYRLDTDGLNPQAVASHILAISGWSDIGP